MRTRRPTFNIWRRRTAIPNSDFRIPNSPCGGDPLSRAPIGSIIFSMQRQARWFVAVLTLLVFAAPAWSAEIVRLRVEDDSLIVAEQELTLPRDSEWATARVELTLADTGPHDLLFRLAQQSGEVVTHNNDERAVVNVRNERIDVLHVEDCHGIGDRVVEGKRFKGRASRWRWQSACSQQ